MGIPGYQNAVWESGVSYLDSTVDRRSVPAAVGALLEYNRYTADRNITPAQQLSLASHIFKQWVGWKLSSFSVDKQIELLRQVPTLLKQEYEKKREVIDAEVAAGNMDPGVALAKRKGYDKTLLGLLHDDNNGIYNYLAALEAAVAGPGAERSVGLFRGGEKKK